VGVQFHRGNSRGATVGDLENLQTLSLSNNQLSGAIPSELGRLENLQVLYLYQNQLSGAIPSDLGRLEILQTLSLSENQLSGAIPSELGRLENLQKLCLHTNQLETPKGAPDDGNGNMYYPDAKTTTDFLRCLRQ
jgi:Leucine-rich repeat (LRR) protein